MSSKMIIVGEEKTIEFNGETLIRSTDPSKGDFWYHWSVDGRQCARAKEKNLESQYQRQFCSGTFSKSKDRVEQNAHR